MKKLLRVLFLLFISCGVDVVEFETQVVEPVDIIKKISYGKNNLLDKSLYHQNSYGINYENRLLLKFKKLLDVQGNIEANPTDRVFIDVKLIDQRQNLNSLKLCPLQTNWTFHATWNFRSQTRKWNNVGGDINNFECVEGKKFDTVFDQAIKESNQSHYVDSDDRIVFDITESILGYVKGGNQNFGWILINNDQTTYIYGEGLAIGSLGAPRLYWTERDSVLVSTWKLRR